MVALTCPVWGGGTQAIFHSFPSKERDQGRGRGSRRIPTGLQTKAEGAELLAVVATWDLVLLPSLGQVSYLVLAAWLAW